MLIKKPKPPRPAPTECTVCGHRAKDDADERSLQQHKRFYGVVKAAFDQWPEASEFRPESIDHLRQWLICAAGPQWRDATTQDVPAPLRNAAIAGFVDVLAHSVADRTARYPFPRVNTWTWKATIYTAKSIKFAKMPHMEFNALSQAVDDVIKAEIGVDPDQLLKEEPA